jgi:hypothetical protein
MSKMPALRSSAQACVALLLLCLPAILFVGGSWAQNHAAVSAKRTLFSRFRLTKFYDTPEPLPAGSPGELIRSDEFLAYDLPMGVSAVRFLYHSRSASGGDVAASGVVLFPDKKAPAGGWPVIAWAHDAIGVARQCAPSLARNLQHGPFLTMYVNVGYAVVATDYTGLGTSFRHAFADTPSNAWDVIESIPAARRAVPGLGSRWVAMGTGEGGMAVVAVAELEHNLHDPNYLGSIAFPRLADLQDMFAPASNFSYDLPLYLAYGIKTVFPEFNVNEILTDKALPLYEQAGKSCGEGAAEQKPGVATMLKPDWKDNPSVQKYFKRNQLGLQPGSASLLVVSSADDPSIVVTKKIVQRLCGQGNRVQFQKYPENDPGMVIGDSARDQMAWLQARFADRQAQSDCSTFQQ